MTRQGAKKRLETAREIKHLVAGYYQEAMEARSHGKPVGWLPPMNGAIELFYAMDLQPVFPENWSPLSAAFGLAPQNFQVSESRGYSMDLCGYLRNILGYVDGLMKQEDGFPLRLPEPDMLISFGGGCIPAMKIFQALENRFPGAAVFRADLPQVAIEDIAEHHIAYAVSVMKDLISFLEEKTGRRLDVDRLREAVSLSDQACKLWDEIMSCRSTVPSPFSAAEIGLMFVMVTLQGTQRAVDFLARVRDEVREKSRLKQGVIPREELRLFWDNIPPWYNLNLFNYFEQFNAVVVAETYSAAWSQRLDPERPFESLAYKSLISYPLVSCLCMKRRIEMVVKACREYKIDGAVFHNNKSCKPITLGQVLIKEALEKELGVPSVIIDGDHMDERNFSMGQFQTRVEAFMEMLKERKGAGTG